MQQWEYEFVRKKLYSEDPNKVAMTTEFLNQKGEEGWELFWMQTQGRFSYLLLKRPKQGEPDGVSKPAAETKSEQKSPESGTESTGEEKPKTASPWPFKTS